MVDRLGGDLNLRSGDFIFFRFGQQRDGEALGLALVIHFFDHLFLFLAHEA